MRDRGSVTFWMLGLSLLIVVFGGLALDFWRALAVQRELAAVADSAALAAASGIDEETYRSSGELILDRDRAESLAATAVAWQEVDLVSLQVSVQPESVEVIVTGEVELGLLGVFVDDREPLTVRARAAAFPLLVP